ncbi:thermonuclease family protein [Sphingomonas sp.]|jgi:endonuclease YncB( thermonuclease family)|uniref:thermonuclease family protein n=1 Tax=Sphingomonas sp. TaxID=28214 RepID=UPI002D80E84D|nr:thermonuclease family protein [Sphingomonas sp.]HEU0045102.1 thermonuclease family protein [Sphingomonas sp.]
MLTLLLLLVSTSPTIGATPARQAAASTIQCRPTDGDTIRCGSERIRLLAIDSPEMPGHCRRGRTCARGNPQAAKASLSALLRSGSPLIRRVGTDQYGRTLAMVSVNGTDLSCHQLRAGHAIYKPRWDDGARVRRTCRFGRSPTTKG